jgi:hypothetical protein
VGPIKQIKSAPIDVSAAGDNEVVAAVENRRIRVLGYTLIAGGAVNAKWAAASGDFSGPLPLAANTGASPSPATPPAFIFETEVGEALDLNLSAAIPVGGHVTYQEVP